MKKSIFVFLAILTIASITQSCKKGEDDPFFSFKSRKMRLVGEWNLYEGISKPGSYVINYDGVNAMMGSESWTHTEKLKFNGDGTYECIIYSDKYYDKCTKIGTWAFGSKDKAMELKAKEYIILRIEDYTYYVATQSGIIEMREIYSGDACPVEMIRFKELRSDQLTTEMDGSIEYYYGNYDSSYVESYTKHFERAN